MPKYRVQLKQGKRTIVEHIEAKSVDSVISLYNTLTTMKLTEVLKIEFQDKSTPPIDDYIYQSLFKGFIKNKDSRKVKQIIFHNLKPGVTELDVYNQAMAHLEIDGLSVDGVTATLFKD
ncbi:hypothetical protein [Sulfurimonas sp. NW9]|uniref:hypothetical protein n=1 Tax=Sulfurimonas sp. NW9 TaxID=2922728 RepID=UPI003DA8A740